MIDAAAGRPSFPCASEEEAQKLARIQTVIPTPTPTPFRVTRTFPFRLPAGSQGSRIVGPVQAGYGPLEVTLDFEGDFVILACVGTQSACYPMGGRPRTETFDIPSDFPSPPFASLLGPIQASVYFNPNFQQPPGAATGEP